SSARMRPADELVATKDTRMSCWVVPSLAAELWHIPLERLLRGIRDGEIAARDHEGFTFVNMAPDGPRIARPQTFTLVSEPPDEPDPSTYQPPQPEPEEGFEDDTASKELGDWRAARRKASRLRIPPRPQQSAN